MCRLAALVVLAALLPLTAAAQSIKQDEVINFPDPQNVTGSVEVTNRPEVQDVNVVNAPPGGEPAAQKVIAFVGVTEATTDGNAGGPFGLSGMCEAEFGSAARARASSTATSRGNARARAPPHSST